MTNNLRCILISRGGRGSWLGVMSPGRVIATKVTRGGRGVKKSDFWGDVIYERSLSLNDPNPNPETETLL